MRAKTHDQRKGQWLINKIRFNNSKYCKDTSQIPSAEQIERIIFNMENIEFDKYMSDYNEN